MDCVTNCGLTSSMNVAVFTCIHGCCPPLCGLISSHDYFCVSTHLYTVAGVPPPNTFLSHNDYVCLSHLVPISDSSQNTVAYVRLTLNHPIRMCVIIDIACHLMQLLILVIIILFHDYGFHGYIMSTHSHATCVCLSFPMHSSMLPQTPMRSRSGYTGLWELARLRPSPRNASSLLSL